jgi:hypothetical protein
MAQLPNKAIQGQKSLKSDEKHPKKERYYVRVFATATYMFQKDV